MMDLKKLGVRNLEIFSNTDESGNIRVNYDNLLEKERVYNEMLEALILQFNIIANCHHMNITSTMISKTNNKMEDSIKKATGKTWDEVEKLL